MPVDYLKETPSQTAGPYVHIGALPSVAGLPVRTQEQLHVVAGAASAGERIRLEGVVLDGSGAPVKDAVLEIWQADGDGNVPREPGGLRRDGWGFSGWGRVSTDDDGHFSFSTVEPGPTEGRPAFIMVTIFGRGLLNRLFTRAYVPAPALESDALLDSLPEDRRDTLIAERDAQGLRFDIRLQGERETVFLSYPGQ